MIRATDLIDYVAKIRKPAAIACRVHSRQEFAPPNLVAWGELRGAAFELELAGARDQTAWARENNVEAMIHAVIATKHKGAGELLDGVCGAFLADVREWLVARCTDPGVTDALVAMGTGVLAATSVQSVVEVAVAAGSVLKPPGDLRRDLAHRIYLALPLGPLGFASGGILCDPQRDVRLIAALEDHVPWFTTRQQRMFMAHAKDQYAGTGGLSDVARSYGLKTLRAAGAWVA